MEFFQLVCNLIILIGGTLLSIKTISEWIGKPIRFFKNRSEQTFDDRVIAIINRLMPDILYKHDLETRDRYLADRQNYLQEIKKEVLSEIQNKLGTVDKLTEQYEALVISAKDVLREKIMQIYFKNMNDKTLTRHEKEALDQYYKDYKAMKGNSYIDKYYKRMETWKIVEDDYDEHCAL